MQFYVVFGLILAVVVAEPPVKPVFLARYALSLQQPQQQAQFLPLPLSGYQVARLEQLPQVYNTPQPVVPESEKNATDDSKEIPSNDETTPKTVANRPNIKNQEKKSEKLIEGEEQTDEGAYYLYHPSGALQKVSYSTFNDAQQMAYSAQLKLQNIQPISGPIYTYNPDSVVYHQFQLQ
ncbi:hypothetical protein RI129_004277 [Pyrocoelia pectoralis]|uniref:Uncharacterized protein n=1 Tax=Pyrocoelia pectoralis TaxID=417401 RepID=A0AAN7VII7_9COLE